MQESGPAGPPSQQRPDRRTLPPVRLPEQGEEIGVEALIAASQAAITARLEEGLKGINQSAARLMKQIAAEVWRAAGPEAPKNLQSGVIGGLARDDALRGVLTHMDERYQALHVEIGRMEEALRRLAGATGRSLKRADETADLVERVTQATHEQGRRTQADLAELARWIERTLGPISTRLGALEAATEAVSTRQRTDLAAFTERTRQSLARVGERLSQAFGVLREQSAAENRSALQALEEAIHQDFDRLETLSREQAAASADVAARISRSLLQLTERTVKAIKGLREKIDAREEERVHLEEERLQREEQRARLEEERLRLEEDRVRREEAERVPIEEPEPLVERVPAASLPEPPPLDLDLEERLSGLRVSIDGLSVIAEDAADPEGTS